MSRKKKRTRPSYYKKKRKLSRKSRIQNKRILSKKKNNNLTLLNKDEIQKQNEIKENQFKSKYKIIRFKCKESFYINNSNTPNNLRYFVNKEYIGYEIDKNVYAIKSENSRILTVSQGFVEKYFRKV